MNSNPPGVQEFRDDGEGNNFLLGNSSRIGKVLIYGHRNTISIGERCRIAGQIVIKCNDGHISIGDGLCCTKPLMSEVPLSPDGFIPRFL